MFKIKGTVAGHGVDIEGVIKIDNGTAVKRWKIVATMRQGDLGPYYALSMPEVKIVSTAAL